MIQAKRGSHLDSRGGSIQVVWNPYALLAANIDFVYPYFLQFEDWMLVEYSPSHILSDFTTIAFLVT
jgi:hypothetical protein